MNSCLRLPQSQQSILTVWAEKVLMWMMWHPYHIFLMNLQKKTHRKKLTQVLCPIQYSMRATDLNAKLRDFNMLWNVHMANHSGTSAPLYNWCPQYRGADKSLAWPTSRCILFDGENISFYASLVLYIYIYSTNIPPIIIINRIYEHKNLLSL